MIDQLDFLANIHRKVYPDPCVIGTKQYCFGIITYVHFMSLFLSVSGLVGEFDSYYQPAARNFSHGGFRDNPAASDRRRWISGGGGHF